MATALIAPNIAYLFKDDQPAINTASVFTEVIAITKISPILRRPKKLLPCKGITAKTIKAGTRNTIGASVKTGLSAPSGIVSSLVNNLTKSAIGCSSPNGPHLFGPNLD